MKNNKPCIWLSLTLTFGFVLACSGLAVPTQTPVPTDTPTATPLPTPTPVPVVIASGTLDIPQTYSADLDTGVIPRDYNNPAYAGVDVWFEAVSSVEKYLEPFNGAQWAVAGLNPVGYNECSIALVSTTRININDLPLGTYICVSTNSQNVAVIRIDGVVNANPGTIRIAFMTWTTH